MAEDDQEESPLPCPSETTRRSHVGSLFAQGNPSR